MKNTNLLNIKKNNKYVVDIIDYGSNGEGIAKIDGFIVFVPFTIVGERAEILIVQVRKDFAFAKVLNIIKSSPYRIEPKCEYFGKCGGCQLQHIEYKEQLKYKKQYVQNCLKKYAGIDVNINDCVPSNKEYNYRNKFSFPVDKINGEIVVGMYRIGSHKLVPINNCALQENCKNIIKNFKKYANKYNLKVYNDTKLHGVKHIVCRNYNKNNLLSVVTTQKTQNIQSVCENMYSTGDFTGIVANINTKDSNVILGDKNILLQGKDSILIEEYGLKYYINNQSFMQVNNYIKGLMYDEVLKQINSVDIVVDAFSGAGVLSAIIAKKCKQVYGIEIVKDAVKTANELAKNNNINNLYNICGDCAIELPKLLNDIGKCTLVLDPPRKGCDNKTLVAINRSLPDKIIYISCNPATLARDLKVLMLNYNVNSITPFDMFPQTANVETLVVLNKK